MPRLYVDVDMTLVLWQDGLTHPFEGAQRYKRNHQLIDAIERFLTTNPQFGFTVWSFGGHEYARLWAERLKLPVDSTMAKDIRAPKPDDICVDDMNLVVDSLLFTPEAFIHYVNTMDQLGELVDGLDPKWMRAKKHGAEQFFDTFEEVMED